jgi:hypothetical protein
MSPSSSRHRPRRHVHPKLVSQPPSLRRDLELRRRIRGCCFVAVARNVDLNHPTDRHGGLLAEASSLEISFRSFSVARRIVTGRLRGGRATLIRANIVGPRLASSPSRRIKPDTENSRSARLYRQFSFFVAGGVLLLAAVGSGGGASIWSCRDNQNGFSAGRCRACRG